MRTGLKSSELWKTARNGRSGRGTTSLKTNGRVIAPADRNLELTSGEHTYEKPGRYKIAVKVIDIFGNDTTKVVEVRL